MKANILVIDDDEGIRISFESFLSNEGHQVLTAEDYKALVDEKERIESEKERYRRNLDLIFRSVKDAIIMVDKDLHVIEANKATQHICGVAPPEMIGKAFSEVITRLYNLERELKERHRFHHIIGKSKKMQEIYRLLENLVGTETTVLITAKAAQVKNWLQRRFTMKALAPATRWSPLIAQPLLKTCWRASCSDMSRARLRVL